MLARTLAIILLVVQPLAAIVAEIALLGVGTPTEARCCCCVLLHGKVECRPAPGPPDQRPSNCCSVDIAAVAAARPAAREQNRDPGLDRAVPSARVAFVRAPGLTRAVKIPEAGGDLGRLRSTLCVWII